MAQDWERDAVIQDLTERIGNREFDDAYDALKQELESTSALTEADRQRLLQYWLSRQRDRGGRGNGR